MIFDDSVASAAAGAAGGGLALALWYGYNVGMQGELIRLGARFVIAGTYVNYALAGARQDTATLRAIPLG